MAAMTATDRTSRVTAIDRKGRYSIVGEMAKRGMLSISKLASLTRVTRDTLLHYDKLGLVQPEGRGGNNYRYYTTDQIAIVNLVRTLQESGLALSDIQEYKRKRTPENIVELFSRQIGQLEIELQELEQSLKLLTTLRDTISDVIGVDESAITLDWVEEEPIFLGPKNDYSGGRGVYDALLDFYLYFEEQGKNVNLKYPAWGYFSQERIERRDWKWPDHYFFVTPDAPDRKPAGYYVTGYTRGGYGQGGTVYKRLMTYIKKNHLRIAGPAYEAYPLNEISIPNPKDYLVKVSILVEQL